MSYEDFLEDSGYEFPSIDEVMTALREEYPGNKGESLARSLRYTGRLAMVHVYDYFPGLFSPFAHARDFEYCLVMAEHPDAIITPIDSIEHAQGFCNRLQKKLEYHVYPVSQCRH